MFKMISPILLKLSQSYMDEIQDPDWLTDDVEGYGDPGFIDESNYQDYLADNNETNEDFPATEQPDVSRPSDSILPPIGETTSLPEETKQIEYDQPQDLIRDGIDKVEVIGFDYTNRYGMYSGFRVVEPHYTFIANTTGNEVLVTFDRNVNDIRAFIVGNIHPFGVRYSNLRFRPRPAIMRGVE